MNTLRDFAGVDPVSFDPALNRRALAAALMMRAAGALSHTPQSNWPCYSAEGADGAGASNLYLGRSGADAMVGYVHDVGVPSLGHRRWLLNPEQATFGTGSTGTTNALYVFGAPAPVPNRPAILAWPPPGHVPWPLIRGSWSAALNLDGSVDASAATVDVSIAGRPATTGAVQDLGNAYGDGHLLKWNVAVEDGQRLASATVTVAIRGLLVGGRAREVRYAIEAFPAEPPEPVTARASRTATTVTVAWDGARERGVPVTGYRVHGFDDRHDRLVIDATVAPDARQITLPYSAPGRTLFLWVTPLSRAGSPSAGPYTPVFAPPVTTGAAPPPVGAVWSPVPEPQWQPAGEADGKGNTPAGVALRFAGPVRLKVAGRRRLGAGGRLVVDADVRGAVRVGYRWLRDGRPIRDARRTVYRTRRADRGKRLRCRVRAVDAAGKVRTKLSRAKRVPRR